MLSVLKKEQVMEGPVAIFVQHENKLLKQDAGTVPEDAVIR